MSLAAVRVDLLQEVDAAQVGACREQPGDDDGGAVVLCAGDGNVLGLPEPVTRDDAARPAGG
jgi:hypothetical protein